MKTYKLHTLKCKLCGCEFEHKDHFKKFCSDICVQKNKSIFQKEYKNSEEGRRKNSESQKIAQNRPEVKLKRSETSKEIANRLDVKEKFSKWSKEYHNREDVKKNTSDRTKKYFKENPEAHSKLIDDLKHYFRNVYPTDDEAKLKRSKSSKKSNSRPEVKEKKSQSMKEYWKDTEKRKVQSIKQREVHNTPEMAEIHRKNSKKLWENIDYANNVFNGMKKYKEFVFPSGKVVKTQGYENLILVNLITEYSESDIFAGPTEIRKQIGKIEYTFNDKLSSYYPDIYIKSTNTIIEVKSVYTFNQHKERNLAKEKSCLDMGFNFKFEIIRK